MHDDGREVMFHIKEFVSASGLEDVKTFKDLTFPLVLENLQLNAERVQEELDKFQIPLDFVSAGMSKFRLDISSLGMIQVEALDTRIDLRFNLNKFLSKAASDIGPLTGLLYTPVGVLLVSSGIVLDAGSSAAAATTSAATKATTVASEAFEATTFAVSETSRAAAGAVSATTSAAVDVVSATSTAAVGATGNVLGVTAGATRSVLAGATSHALDFTVSTAGALAFVPDCASNLVGNAETVFSDFCQRNILGDAPIVVDPSSMVEEIEAQDSAPTEASTSAHGSGDSPSSSSWWHLGATTLGRTTEQQLDPVAEQGPEAQCGPGMPSGEPSVEEFLSMPAEPLPDALCPDRESPDARHLDPPRVPLVGQGFAEAAQPLPQHLSETRFGPPVDPEPPPRQRFLGSFWPSST